ncbi:GDP-fucose protein O-fucosyltransferase 2 [Diachasma alloeum]|uniref:GDP-fucose protein O-fucosyltransferase 2 n=1 Tax=Diachasma alloeum TaxID=454923 RepID=UPI00073816FB|nr:GDP-fucose protein O-fucosyltransferase 2 [Diachasma alloeum]XP_015120800.1 GDP-fucose protein O-fucosyltransferase 2 [Diachasma alloeum]XP_015120801.1 GDP-fucose protein O-fucosyltransferase 2 [Diachasma alloeum]
MCNVNKLSSALKLYFFSLLINEILCLNSEFCGIPQNSAEHVNCGGQKYLSNKRYILYDVNPPEGFNLRRDVYVRMAVFIHNLNQADKIYQWNLVLPPWDHLYHWRSRDIGEQSQIPWGTFFDIPSLMRFIPVIEMHQFFKDYESTNGVLMLDRVFVLRTDPKMFENNDFRDRNEITTCNEYEIRFKKISDDKVKGYFWGYNNITAKDVQCLLFHGAASNLVQNLEPTLHKTYMFDHMEIPIHDSYGSRDFWRARRSMRFNSELYEIAGLFRQRHLSSIDDDDKTVRPRNWLDEKEHRTAIGGPYLAVHWRRKDFLIGRSAYVPSIAKAARQLRKIMENLGLEVVFIATDGEDHEFEELREQMGNYNVVRYIPSDNVRQKFKDGGVAIIDQIICSYARHFIGTYESTFTFRIQEEREIIGFRAETTFNNICWKDEECSPQSQWKITW